jgi:hypothetical protein
MAGQSSGAMGMAQHLIDDQQNIVRISLFVGDQYKIDSLDEILSLKGLRGFGSPQGVILAETLVFRRASEGKFCAVPFLARISCPRTPAPPRTRGCCPSQPLSWQHATQPTY